MKKSISNLTLTKSPDQYNSRTDYFYNVLRSENSTKSCDKILGKCLDNHRHPILPRMTTDRQISSLHGPNR